MTSKTPLEEKPQRYPNEPLSNNHYIVADKQVPSSAPYTAARPIAKQTNLMEQSTTTQQRPGNQKPTESYEMVSRRTNQPPTTSTSKTTAQQNGRSRKSRDNKSPPIEETESSYF
jgi:hypothetical protein